MNRSGSDPSDTGAGSRGFGTAILRETLFYMAGVAGAALVAFLATPLYARSMGPEEYGRFALALAAAAPLMAIARLGLDVAFSRYWFELKSPAARRDLTASLLVFGALWCVVLTVLGAGAIVVGVGFFGLSRELALLFMVALAALFPVQIFYHLQQVLRNQFRPVPFAATSVGAALLGTGFGVLLVVGLGWKAAGALLGTVVVGLVGCLLTLPLVSQAVRGKVSWSAFYPLLKLGAPLVPASLAFWIFTGFDKIVVADKTSDLGSYAVAAQIALALSLVVTAIGQAWLPRVLKEEGANRDRVATVITFGSEATLAILGSVAAVMGLAASWLVGIVGGPGFAKGAEALPLLAAANAFLGTSMITVTGAILAKRTKRLPVITVVIGVIDIVLLLILVPLWGLVGAGVSLMVAYVLMTWLSLSYAQSVYPLPFRYGRLALLSLVVAGQAAFVAVRPGDPFGWALASLPVIWSIALVLRLVRPRSSGSETE